MTSPEIIALLCVSFPKCFAHYEGRRKPLKIGISADILAALGDQVDPKALGLALRLYVANLRYRMAQQAGAPRIDLDGNEAGTVSERDAARAAGDVAKRKAREIAKRQEALRLPRQPKLSNAAHVQHLPPELAPEPQPPPEPPKRGASLADLRAAGQRRKAPA